DTSEVCWLNPVWSIPVPTPAIGKKKKPVPARMTVLPQRRGTPGDAQSRPHIHSRGFEQVAARGGWEEQAAVDDELRRREIRQRMPGVGGTRGDADGTGRVEIKAAHRPVVALRGG